MDNRKTIVHFTYSWITSGVCGFITDTAETIKKYDHKIVVWDLETDFYNKRLEKSGCELISLGGNSSSPVSMAAAARSFTKYLVTNKPDIVHIHCSCAPELIFAKAAKKAGISIRISHCHNAGFEGSGAVRTAKVLLNGISKSFFGNAPTERLACSKAAAETLYKNSVISDNKYRIIKNGIDTERYSFSEEKRNSFRKKHGLEGKTVLCAVGRLSEQKDPILLLKSFSDFFKKDPDSALVFAGDGPLREQCADYAASNVIEKNVIFLGSVSDVAEVLSASDIFVMCSRYEGFGTAALEAQANGIPCVLSDAVCSEADVSGHSIFIPHSSAPYEWANAIDKASCLSRFDGEDAVKSKGYAKADSMNELEALYDMILSDN